MAGTSTIAMMFPLKLNLGREFPIAIIGYQRVQWWGPPVMRMLVYKPYQLHSNTYHKP